MIRDFCGELLTRRRNRTRCRRRPSRRRLEKETRRLLVGRMRLAAPRMDRHRKPPTEAARPARPPPAAPPPSRDELLVPGRSDPEPIPTERPHLDRRGFDPQEGSRCAALPRLELASGHGCAHGTRPPAGPGLLVCRARSWRRDLLLRPSFRMPALELARVLDVCHMMTIRNRLGRPECGRCWRSIRRVGADDSSSARTRYPSARAPTSRQGVAGTPEVTQMRRSYSCEGNHVLR